MEAGAMERGVERAHEWPRIMTAQPCCTRTAGSVPRVRVRVRTSPWRALDYEYELSLEQRHDDGHNRVDGRAATTDRASDVAPARPPTANLERRLAASNAIVMSLHQHNAVRSLL